ncbi:MAG TPA: transcriptional repressor [Azospirillum sp.]|nr:transcriptional repressor [Azospirillum sp.]
MRRMQRWTLAADHLRSAGLVVTRPRILLFDLLFGKGDRLVTPEELYQEACDAGMVVARATVYNTLHALAEHGLLRTIVIDAERIYFDTDTRHVCRLYHEDSRHLYRLPDDTPGLHDLIRHLGDISPLNLEILIRIRASRDGMAVSKDQTWPKASSSH